MNVPQQPIDLALIARTIPKQVEQAPLHKPFFDEADSLCKRIGISRKQLAEVLHNIKPVTNLLSWRYVDAYLIVLEKT